MGLRELLLFVAAVWGVPLGLLWISWHRYVAVRTATGTSRVLACASLALLALSAGIWLLFLRPFVTSDVYNALKAIWTLCPNPTILSVANIHALFVFLH